MLRSSNPTWRTLLLLCRQTLKKLRQIFRSWKAFVNDDLYRMVPLVCNVMGEADSGLWLLGCQSTQVVLTRTTRWLPWSERWGTPGLAQVGNLRPCDSDFQASRQLDNINTAVCGSVTPPPGGLRPAHHSTCHVLVGLL